MTSFKLVTRSHATGFMILVKANQDSEAGVMPSQKLLADMGKFNEELVKAGIMRQGKDCILPAKARGCVSPEPSRRSSTGHLPKPKS
jgi:hypothetical protein